MRILIVLISSIGLMSCSASRSWLLKCTPLTSDLTSRTNVLANIEQVAAEYGFVRRETMASHGEMLYTRRADRMGKIFMRVPSTSSDTIQVEVYEYPIVGTLGSTSTNVIMALDRALKTIPSCQVAVTNIVH